ncbi:MAG: hypothetical protein P4L80_00130 [Xanthobacteraceae bacterium]|nr:hypothetical protein [Xanthobacteraceae bacterium]
MLRRLIQAGAMVALLTGPAFAQAPQSSQSSLSVPLKTERPLTQEEIDKQKAADRAYEAAINKIPDKKSSSDPWGNIRQPSPTASKNNTQ